MVLLRARRAEGRRRRRLVRCLEARLFAREYKGKHANLDAAFNQLRHYALALDNPPLLIVSDMARFRIRTNWTNSVSVTHDFTLGNFADGATRDELKWAMSDLERLRPGETRQTVAKHRLFVWLDARICPDSATITIARDDDTTFGIMHSRFHQAWSLRLGTWLGKGNDPRYTPTTTFETFPFPDGLSPDIPADDYANDPCSVAIAVAAQRLVEVRDRRLNPPEWVK